MFRGCVTSLQTVFSLVCVQHAMLLVPEMCCRGNARFWGGCDVSHVVTPGVRGDFFFHLCSACIERHRTMSVLVSFLQNVFFTYCVELSASPPPWNVHLSCLCKRIACFYPSSTVLWERRSSEDDSGKQGANFRAGITVYMEHFSYPGLLCVSSPIFLWLHIQRKWSFSSSEGQIFHVVSFSVFSFQLTSVYSWILSGLIMHFCFFFYWEVLLFHITSWICIQITN